MENSIELPKKELKNRTTILWNNSSSGHLFEENEGTILKDICTSKFITALFAIVNIWKWPRCPSVDEWIKKLWDIYLYIMLFSHKKNEIVPDAATCMEFNSVMLSRISQRKTSTAWSQYMWMWILKRNRKVDSVYVDSKLITTTKNSCIQSWVLPEVGVGVGEMGKCS